jgi:hypothetical protein
MQIFRRLAALLRSRRPWALERPEDCVDLHERLAAY